MNVQFLKKVNQLINEIVSYTIYSDATMECVVELYNKMIDLEKQESLNALLDICEEGTDKIFILSVLLCGLKDYMIVDKIEDTILSENIENWDMITQMYNLDSFIFMNDIAGMDKIECFYKRKQIYKKVIEQIREKLTIPNYVPYKKRKKTVLIAVRQLLGKQHAPTRKALVIADILESLGYEVGYIVCNYQDTKNPNIWYQRARFNNFTNFTQYFEYKCDASHLCRGVNLQMDSKNYIEGLQILVNCVKDINPEWILEIGDKTLIAELCGEFTSIVTMGCTRDVPFTYSEIIARYFNYSEEEEIEYQKLVEKNQIVIDVKHNATDEDEIKLDGDFCRKDFGITDDCFLIIIAGNRLENEISDSFLDSLLHELSTHLAYEIAFIGNTGGLSEKIPKGYFNRVHFLGRASQYRKTIAIGDVFLNPPRVGGGGGGVLAILSGVPVISLKHCDVASAVGDEFTCDSLDDMMKMLERYYNDKEYMKKQIIIGKENAYKWIHVDGKDNFRRLCELIKKRAMEKEKESQERR